MPIAGVNGDTVEGNRRWSERLHLRYTLLSDHDRVAARAFNVVRRIGVGGWNIELFRRTTFLADERGILSAVWGKVNPRGHAREVLKAAQVLRASAT